MKYSNTFYTFISIFEIRKHKCSELPRPKPKVMHSTLQLCVRYQLCWPLFLSLAPNTLSTHWSPDCSIYSFVKRGKEIKCLWGNKDATLHIIYYYKGVQKSMIIWRQLRRCIYYRILIFLAKFLQKLIFKWCFQSIKPTSFSTFFYYADNFILLFCIWLFFPLTCISPPYHSKASSSLNVY
jgi:hypothetical protein